MCCAGKGLADMDDLDLASAGVHAPLERDDEFGDTRRRSASLLRRQLAFRFPVRYRVVWVALILLVAYVQLTTPATLGETSMKLTTALAGVLLFASLGQLLVVISGGLDITVSAVMTLSAGIVVRETQGANDRLLQACLTAVAVAMLIGLVNGLLIVRLRLNPLIVTLAMSAVITGGMFVWTGVTFSLTGNVPTKLHDFAAKSFGSVNAVGISAVVVALAVAGVLRSTAVGRRYLAVGTNPVAARIIGIRVDLYRVAAYVVCSGFAALAGILLGGYLRVPDFSLGSPYLLLTFVTMALAGASLSGGPASVVCLIGSCFFLALLDQYLAVRGVGAGAAPLLQGVVLVLSVAALTLATTARQLVSSVVHRVRTWTRAVPDLPTT